MRQAAEHGTLRVSAADALLPCIVRCIAVSPSPAALRKRKDAAGNIARAASNVKHPRCRLPGLRPHGAELINEPVFPQTVDARTHHVIHDIVAGRYRMKYLAHHGLFLSQWHLAKAEVRRV